MSTTSRSNRPDRPTEVFPVADVHRSHIASYLNAFSDRVSDPPRCVTTFSNVVESGVPLTVGFTLSDVIEDVGKFFDDTDDTSRAALWVPEHHGGNYIVNCVSAFGVSTGGTYRSIALKINGTAMLGLLPNDAVPSSGSTLPTYVKFSEIVSLPDKDPTTESKTKLEFSLSQDSGSSLTVVGRVSLSKLYPW